MIKLKQETEENQDQEGLRQGESSAQEYQGKRHQTLLSRKLLAPDLQLQRKRGGCLEVNLFQNLHLHFLSLPL